MMNYYNINLVMIVTIGYTMSLSPAGVTAPKRERVHSDGINLNCNGSVRI